MIEWNAADGLYEITSERERKPAHAFERFILIRRKGRLFGADPQGRVYTGELDSHPKQPASRIFLRGTYKIPLRYRSARHPAHSRPSYAVPITGEIDPYALSQNATVFVGGKKIDIQITYLCPLPSQ
ncbi:hypothetical protein [Hyphomicrobium sp. ghe19]|uniref:hypothetical protein n=1 Tax=Hyphomicrobium sp. ghe19 TaxID=2682968 RepID=UPI0013678DFD|nr:hypothetical protein HYPP_04181 [Hyphomicrobium sp. ghe19]